MRSLTEKQARTLKGRMAALSTFVAMVRKEFIIMLRYPAEFVASFFQVFVIIIVLTLAGLMFAPGGAEAEAGATTTGLVAYGFVLFMYLSDTLWAIGFNVRREQKQGTLEQLYLSPASKFASLAARVTLTLVWTGLLSLMAVLLMGLMLGRLPFHNGWLGFYLLIMVLSGTFGTGFAFAALTLRIKEAAQTAVNLLQFTFMVVCAPFFPFAALPPLVQVVARFIPLAYGVDAFRSTLMGYPPGFPELAPIEVEIVIVSLFGLLMPLVGVWLYQRAEERARRMGSLAAY